MSAHQLEISVMPGSYSVCRLPADAPVPSWARRSALTSITLTEDELSIVCATETVPDDVRREDGWRALKVAGPLDMSMTGVLASLAEPLATAHVPIMSVSTFDTDYVLVGQPRLEEAVEALRDAGHRVAPQQS